MQIKHLFLISIFMWLGLESQLTAQEQPPFFKVYGVRQGLPSQRILNIHEDAQGFIWLATNNGLSRFDAYDFDNFSNSLEDSLSLNGDYISTLTSDSLFMWVGHYEGGVDLFDMRTGKVLKHWGENSKTDPLPDDRITFLWFEKNKERVWVGSSKKHFVWIDTKTGKVTRPQLLNHPKNQYPSPKTNSIYDVIPLSEHKGTYWLATNEGLALYDEASQRLRYFYPKKPKSGYYNYNRLRDLLQIGENIWIATRGDGGLLKFNTKTYTFEKFQLTKRKHTLSTKIIKKSDNTLWIGTKGALEAIISFDVKTQKSSSIYADPSKTFQLQSNVIFNLFQDRKQQIWIASEKGLNFFSESHQQFPLYPIEKQGSPIENSTPLTFIELKNHFYVGLKNSKGIIKINKDTRKQSFIPTNEKAQLFSFIRMAISPKKNLWVTGQNAIFKYSEKQKLLIRQKIPNGNNIKIQSLHFLTPETILLGTRFNGLKVWNLKKNTLTSINHKTDGLVHDRFINEIVEDKKGNIWIGTERGLSVLKAKSLEVIKNFGLKEGYKMTYRLTLDERGILWASSENKGVYGFDTETLEKAFQITKSKGLPSNAVQHIAADQKGHLWISTQQGLCRYKYSDESTLTFNSENGLIENHLEGSLNALKDHSLVLGFKGSYTLFKPNTFTKQNKGKAPIISKVKQSEGLFFLKKEPNKPLSYSQNNVSISYSALDFSSPQNLSYEYRLKGLSDDWTIGHKQHEVNFISLREGKYNFQVRYKTASSDGWSPPASYAFEISPPFWRSYSFYISLSLLAISAIGLFYHFKVSQIKQKEEFKTTLNNELNALEMKALRSQMNPHFIFNTLNSIKYFVIKNEPKKASKYLNDFAKLIRRIFNNAQNEFSILEEEIETLRLFLIIEQLRFGHKLSFRFIIDPELELSFIKVPNMLVQPFIENSVWHGIMHKKEGGEIVLNFQKIPNNYLRIEVKDNGVGRHSSQKNTFQTIDHKSKGIDLIKKRIAIINQNLNLNISLQIEDLYEDTKAAGTKVILTMKILDV